MSVQTASQPNSNSAILNEFIFYIYFITNNQITVLVMNLQRSMNSTCSSLWLYRASVSESVLTVLCHSRLRKSSRNSLFTTCSAADRNS